MTTLGRLLSRHMAWVVAVVATLLVVTVLPQGTTQEAASNDPLIAGPAGVPAATGDSVQTAALESGEQATGAAPGGGTAATASGGQSASASAAAPAGGGATYPGVGTPAALANPRCDTQRQRMKLASLWSPPCVVPWPKGADNGGATAMGITADKIRVLVRLSTSSTSDDEEIKREATNAWRMFENHLELWGRKIELVFFKPTGTDEIAQRADAVQAFNQYKPFMATALYNVTGGPARTWSTELAARGVIVFDTDPSWSDTQAQPGFRWGYAMDDGVHAQMIGEWVGKRVINLPAKWAGDVTYQTKPRVLGLVHPDQWQKRLFDAQAAKYGIKLADTLTYKQGDDPTTLQERARVHIARLKEKGVSSVIAVTDFLYTAVLTKEATASRYLPEWIVTGWGLQDTTLMGHVFDQQQWSHAFGIGLIPLLPLPEHWEQNEMYRFEYGKPADDTATVGTFYLFSRDIVPAFQLAGPTLTPATFKQAMFNKPPSGAPWNDGRITTGTSYGKQWLNLPWEDYSGYDGMNETWYDPKAQGRDEAVYLEAPGSYRRLNMGKYYQLGGFPTGEPKMFDPAIAPATIDAPPPEDETPDYPKD